MRWLNPKNNIEYDDGIDVRFTTKNVEDITKKHFHYLSLDGLRTFVEGCKDLPGTTPVFYDNISEYMLLEKGNGWDVTPLVWEQNDLWGPTYIPAIPAWQMFLSHDKNNEPAIVLTAHY